MKVTISIPGELEVELRQYIEARFGDRNARAFSLIVREALKAFLDKARQQGK